MVGMLSVCGRYMVGMWFVGSRYAVGTWSVNRLADHVPTSSNLFTTNDGDRAPWCTFGLEFDDVLDEMQNTTGLHANTNRQTDRHIRAACVAGGRLGASDKIVTLGSTPGFAIHFSVGHE